MKPFGKLFEELASENPLFSELKMRMLLMDWEGLVGPLIARHTAVEKVANGVIHVVCDDSLWLTELSFQKDKILHMLNEKAGKIVFRDMVFRRGKINGEVLS
ncbi:DUF721 domain-containing protein [Thermotoga sp.]|uniref:DUF721 domain-containing protein n=1 Tax=Thermotoga sp. TaxID=28240 RepID=UPI0025D4DEDC|nr:DUF721 domain-containing protein [Thermotoga sp.]MCD6552320.1 DUF721 domain-containing protein [Thermotoga sp.]